jgi:cold shock protein
VTEDKRYTGTVKFFDVHRGFGFIRPADGSADVFVHASAVDAAGIRLIGEGDQLEYSVEPDKKNGKTKAANLRLL